MSREISIIDHRPMTVGESPLWDESKELLYTVDFRGRCLRCSSISGKLHRELRFEKEISAVALCESGQLLAAMEDGVYHILSDGSLRPFWVPEKLKGRRLNDGKVGPDGKYYVGSKDETHKAALYCCDTNGTCEEVLSEVGSSNGSAWSGNGKSFFYCDSADKELCVFDFNNGRLKNRRSIIKVPEGIGEFDGMAIDSQDKLWCAVWNSGKVYRIDPEKGQVLESICFPVSKVSSCTFAGRDLKTLVVTSARIRTDIDKEPLAGCTFAVELDVAGRPAHRFGFRK